MAEEKKHQEPILVIKDIPYYATTVARNDKKKNLVYPAPSKEYVLGEMEKAEAVLKQAGFVSPLFASFPLSNFFGRTGASKLKGNCQIMAEDCCQAEEVEGLNGKMEEIIDYDTFDIEEFRKLGEEGRVTSRGLTMADLDAELKDIGDEMTEDGEYAGITCTPQRIGELIVRMKEINREKAAKKRAPRTPKPATPQPVAA